MRIRLSLGVPVPRPASRLALGLLCALTVAALVPSSAWAVEGGLRCEELTFPVTLSASDATVYNVFGVLCSQGDLEHKTVQIALHGITYSHLYWDWPFRPEKYSYLRRATAAGYGVLSLDRIGIGKSDHPPAEAVTIESNAYVVHQIVQALRGGNLVVPSFGRLQIDRVVLVGHSLGSVISIQEAGTFGDVDGVVLTGMSHTVSIEVVNQIVGVLYPASLDPLFAGRNIPDGYLTTLPGTRMAFQYPPAVDPLVVAIDEQTKETVTAVEIETAFPALALSFGIHAPVFVEVGDFDPLFCAPPSCSLSGSLSVEPGFYPADACTETAIIADAGHDLNLEYPSQVAFDAVLSWVDRRVGSDTRVPAPQPCQP
jgi:pimeloyl-ACP methyl ester carboxylesterase